MNRLWLIPMICLLPFFSHLARAEEALSYDADGFVQCFQSAEAEGRLYLFFWDRATQLEERTVHYLTNDDYFAQTGRRISTCSGITPLAWPENLRVSLASELAILLPPLVQESIRQIEHGGRTFRRETTAASYFAAHQDEFQDDSPEILSQLKSKYGTQFAGELMSIWLEKRFAPSENCDHLIGSCDFYLCKERSNPCGVNGYNLGFGYKYCSGSRFSLLPKMESQAGQTWVAEVFTCLQSESAQFPNGLSCNQTKQASFESHAGCYLRAGFCSLPLVEKLRIFDLVKSEILSPSTVGQATQVLGTCIGGKP